MLSAVRVERILANIGCPVQSKQSENGSEAEMEWSSLPFTSSLFRSRGNGPGFYWNFDQVLGVPVDSALWKCSLVFWTNFDTTVTGV